MEGTCGEEIDFWRGASGRVARKRCCGALRIRGFLEDVLSEYSGEGEDAIERTGGVVNAKAGGGKEVCSILSELMISRRQSPVEIQEKMTCINVMMLCKISGVAYLCRCSRHTEDAIALVSRERGEVRGE